MINLFALPGGANPGLPEPSANRSQSCRVSKTTDFRRLLSDLKRRSPSERDFLRKLLKRAATAKASTNFPATILAIPDHAANP